MTLIIGNGRTANHFAHYFQLLKLPFKIWSRKQSPDELTEFISKSQRVLVLISDSALQNFVTQYLNQFYGPIIHMSGALEIEGATSAHPLMTFSSELYDLEVYKNIPFILTNTDNFTQLFPELPNPHYCIERKDKAFYHALCVISGNFTTLLWQEAFKGFAKIGLPPNVAHPYLKQITSNLSLESEKKIFTGPLARKDFLTVTKNLEALTEDKLQNIYKVFVGNYFPEFKI